MQAAAVIPVYNRAGLLSSLLATVTAQTVPFTRVIVVDNGRVAGIFTERDALFRVVAEGRDVRTTRLAQVMTRNPQTVNPEQPFSAALQMMYGGKFRHVPVVEDGRPVGIISARDAMGPELEAFVFELLRQEHVENVLA